MAAKKSFYEYTKEIDNLPEKSKKDKLNKIIADILHDCSDKDIPIFLGTVDTNLSETKFIYQIYDISGSILCYPYAFTFQNGSEQNLRAIAGNLKYPKGTKCVFSVSCGRMYHEHELLSVAKCKSFEELRLTDSSTPEEIQDAIQKEPCFKDALDSFESFLRKEESRLNELFKSKDQLESELEKANSDLEDKNEKIESAKSTLNELETKKEQKTQDWESFSKDIDDKIEKKNEKKNGLEKEIKEKKKALEQIENNITALEPQNTKLEEINKKLKKEKIHLEETMNKYTALGLYESTYETEFDTEGEQSTLNLTDIKGKLSYEYDKQKVDRFLMALNTDQIIVMSGDPGTGKTTFVVEMAKALDAKCTMIQVQSNWTDISDLIGYYNPMQGTYHSTPFLDALIEARNEYGKLKDDSRLHIICLDEMNLAKVEYYFATFLSILTYPKDDYSNRTIRPLPHNVDKWVKERLDKIKSKEDISDEDKHNTSLLADYGSFKLPPNVRFVGTLNMDDTTNMLSPKVIDRSFFIEFSRGDGDKKQNPKSTEEKCYYPCDIFCKEPGSEKHAPFAEIEKNNRLSRFVREMREIYVDLLQLDADENNFHDLVAISKLLPAINSEADLEKFNENYKKYLNISNPNKSKWPLTSARCGKIQSSYWID